MPMGEGTARQRGAQAGKVRGEAEGLESAGVVEQPRLNDAGAVRQARLVRRGL